MKSNNFLLVVTSDQIKEMKVKGVNFLFPINNYSVGFLKTYSFDEIDMDNAFLYINRIFDHKAIVA